MPLDTSIPLQAQPQQFNPLQMALQATQLRAYNTNAQSQQQQLDSNNALSAAIAGATKNGVTDWDAAMGNAAANPAAAFNLPQFAKSVQEMRQAKQTYEKGGIELNDAQIKNAENARAYTLKQFGALDPNDPNFASKLLAIGANSVQLGHVDPKVVIASLSNVPDDPQGRAAWLQRSIASLQDPTAQLNSITPKPTMVDNGATKQYIDTNPLSNPSIVGTKIQNQLSPEAATSPVSVMGPGNTPGVVPRGEMWNAPPLPSTGPTTPNGPDKTYLPGQAPAPSGPAHFVPTGTPMGVQGSNDGNVDTVNTHWKALTNDANDAQNVIGLAQNIKAYAKQAATGKQGDKLAAANGILSIFGQGGQTDLNTATDLLQKNMARLSLTSRQGAGGTDAAGALATAANPHGSMTMAAIEDAADQVIGARKMALAQQQLLQPYKLKNDVAGYQTALSQFNQAADPRIWQFADMDAQQRAKFKAGMSPADQKAFGNKIRTLEGMGAIK